MRGREKKVQKPKRVNALTTLVLVFTIGIVFFAIFDLYGSDNNGNEYFPEEISENAALDEEGDDKEIAGGEEAVKEEKEEGENNISFIEYDKWEIDLDYLLDTFSDLRNPMPGTVISWKDAHLPGAARPYRKGIHQGIDFYAAESGGGITLGSPVQAAAPGTIVRIDHDYEKPTLDELSELSNQCRELGKTPEDILDIFRGRQIWIEHEKGYIIRYCHLHEVSTETNIGDSVESGDIIGSMGYSGTTEPDRPHLHLEIWIGDNYLGEGMTVNQIREFFQKNIFSN